MTARIFEVIFDLLLGLWLFISTFMWPHGRAQAMNAAICGALCMVLALVRIFYEPTRYVTAGLGTWLFLSTLVMPALTPVTSWHNAVIGIAMFVSALAGGSRAEERRHREAFAT